MIEIALFELCVGVSLIGAGIATKKVYAAGIGTMACGLAFAFTVAAVLQRIFG